MPQVPEDPPRQEGEDAQEDQEDGAWVDAELLRDALGGGKVLHLDVQRAVGKGENYLSVLYRTRVEFQPPGSKEVHVKNLIVKGFPPGEFMIAFIEEVGFFRRESAVYDDALPRFYALAEERLGKESFRRFSANGHKSTRRDTVILDDLRPEGYVMASRRDRLDLAHSKLVVQNLARLHALSLAYEEQHPGYISQFDDRMYSEVNRDNLEKYIPPQIKSIVEEIKKWEEYTEIAKKLEVLVSKSTDKLIDICKPVKGGRKVLVHGDCWVNNILFKYDESGKPVDLRFVDFQWTREASPGLDLNYFLFSSPQIDVRIRHFDDLLHEYCFEFQRLAKGLGYGGPIITFDEICQEVNRTLYFGFSSVLTTLPVLLIDPNDSPDMSQVTEEDIENGDAFNIYDKVYQSKRFRETFESLLPYFDERGVLD